MSRADLDLFEKFKEEYIASKIPVLVNTRPGKFLCAKGKGTVEDKAFSTKMAVLYKMVFAIRASSKAEGRGFAVCKLEAVWWGRKENPEYRNDPPSEWAWKLMIRVPNDVSEMDRIGVLENLLAKGEPEGLTEVGLEEFREGPCVQMLHEGPYTYSPMTLKEMREFARSREVSFRGFTHEIFLSDPRRLEQNRFKMIVRQPVVSV